MKEKIPIVDGAGGASGVLFSFREAFYVRKNLQLKGRSNDCSDVENTDEDD
jgi:hypothetical protein